MLSKRFFKTKEETEVTFEFAHPEADKVALVAEFNDWQPVPMTFVKKDKVFRAKTRLPKDRVFHFRYLINDEKWENDYQADAYQPNCFGSEDSVVYTSGH